MAITKQKKATIVANLKPIVDSAKALVFVNFHGLPVAEANRLRRGLKELGIGYVVAKKSLIKLALGSAKNLTGTVPELPGEIAMAYPKTDGSEDELLAPAKQIHTFAKGLTEPAKLEIVGGLWSGEYRPAEFMKELATIPDKQTLLGKLAWLLNYPMQSLAVGINEVAKKKVE